MWKETDCFNDNGRNLFIEHINKTFKIWETCELRHNYGEAFFESNMLCCNVDIAAWILLPF